jgi:hypothetical protein
MALSVTNAIAMILLIIATAGTSMLPTFVDAKNVPSSNQTQLKSTRKRKSAPNDYHCSGTKLFPFLMKQPPVDKDDVPLAFQFDDLADDTKYPLHSTTMTIYYLLCCLLMTKKLSPMVRKMHLNTSKLSIHHYSQHPSH